MSLKEKKDLIFLFISRKKCLFVCFFYDGHIYWLNAINFLLFLSQNLYQEKNLWIKNINLYKRNSRFLYLFHYYLHNLLGKYVGFMARKININFRFFFSFFHIHFKWRKSLSLIVLSIFNDVWSPYSNPFFQGVVVSLIQISLNIFFFFHISNQTLSNWINVSCINQSIIFV